MIGTIFRALLGFLLACLAAAVTKVLYVMTPAQLSALPSDVVADRLSSAAIWSLAVATHDALFAWPTALVAIAIAEWRGIRHWVYYVLSAIAIVMAGYAAQYMGETGGQPSIANNYAFIAFLTAGFVAGLVYWMASGRRAGGRKQSQPAESVQAPAQATAETPPSA